MSQSRFAIECVRHVACWAALALPLAAQENTSETAADETGAATEPAPSDTDETPPATGPVDRRLTARRLPLSLDAALTLSETNNLGLMLEDISTEVAHFNAMGSWGSFDWVFGASARYTDFERSPTSVIQGLGKQEGAIELYQMSLTRPMEYGGAFSTTFTSSKTTSNAADAISASLTQDDLSVAYSQPLLRGFGADYGTSVQQESDYLYLQQIERRREIRQKLLRNTSDAYWNLVQTINQLGVATSSLELGREQRERNQRLLDAGVGTEVEVIQAAAEVARREETRLAADVTMRIAGDALKTLLFPGKDNESWNTVIEPSTPLPEDVSVDDLESWETCLERALEMRPELRQQLMQIDIAELRHDRAISERRAGLDLDSSISTQGRDLDWVTAKESALDFDTISWVVGLSLDAPIQNRTRIYSERAARVQIRAARITLEQLQTQVVTEVRDAVRQLHYQSLAVSAAGTSRRATERQLDAELARYENDLSTNFQVLEFQLQLVEAMNNEQTARANFAKALYQLETAQGTIGERH